MPQEIFGSRRRLRRQEISPFGRKPVSPRIPKLSDDQNASLPESECNLETGETGCDGFPAEWTGWNLRRERRCGRDMA